jgi:MFS family permease
MDHREWLVLLAAAGTFALTMGTRQTMGLFLSPQHLTGLGLGSISLAFAFGQLWWGLTQPFAGAVADRIGAGRVLLAGVLLVALGTFITPLMTTTAGLIFAIGVLSAGGAGMAGPAVLMAATTRLVPPGRRGLATGIVNAGGSFGQFVMAPIAAALTAGVGWVARCSHGRAGAAVPAGGLSCCGQFAAGRPGRAASGRWARAKPCGTALAHPQLPAAGRRLLRLRLSRGLPGHAPARRVARAGCPRSGRLVAGVIGLFNIVGSVGMGWAVGRWRMKSLLSLVYATRAWRCWCSCWRPRPRR